MDAIKKDIAIPVKILIMYMAGIRRMPTLGKLPGSAQPFYREIHQGLATDIGTGSPEFLQAVRQKGLKIEESESAIRRYLSWLTDVAAEHARKCKMTIEALITTFPNYL
jgi:hypothetical protein